MPMPNATSPCTDMMSTAGSPRGSRAFPAPAPTGLLASRAARTAARLRCPSLTLLVPPRALTTRTQPPPPDRGPSAPTPVVPPLH
eukprot:12202410-Alexandrium_andersonii.AAC.1